MSVTESKTIISDYNEYVQSANTLFHFMKNEKYLIDALKQKALIPRYCVEDIDYLKIKRDDTSFKSVAVLQKCFCDIPLSKLFERTKVHVTDWPKDLSAEDKTRIRVKTELGMTHLDCYGYFALAFPKNWGERNNIQPVQYINITAEEAFSYAAALSNIISCNESYGDEVVEYFLNRVCFMKPLRGSMIRDFDLTGRKISIPITKNFHNECEWRYVPLSAQLKGTMLEKIIAVPSIVTDDIRLKSISSGITQKIYEKMWLKFKYEDIKYIIVPNPQSRVNIINLIRTVVADENNSEKVSATQDLLISKILVISEMNGDL